MSATPVCPNCGAPVTPGANFCMRCGADTSGQQSNVQTERIVAAPTMRPTMSPKVLLSTLREATLGEYEIVAELGRGGMATVFLGHDIALDRKVAIKVMSPALMSGEGMLERFKREARTAAALSHPHIIPIYAVRETEQLFFFVMKFVKGRPLDSIIREIGPMPIPMVQTILYQVGGALGHAHRKGVVHRDIKPGNIMIDEDGWAVVTDFGIAKVNQAQGLTITGATVGTPTYMSPEQCAAKEITGASDQYSLGVVAYEMLSGKVPFAAESIMAVMYAHFNETPSPISERRRDCPPFLANAVMRMLEKEPARRWPSVEDAAKAIGGSSLAHDDPIRTRMIGLARDSTGRRLLAEHITPESPVPAGRGSSVTSSPASLVIAPPGKPIPVGQAHQLALTASDGQGNRLETSRATWVSSNPDVAAVTGAGLVRGMGSGSTTVTAQVGALSASIEVRVRGARAMWSWIVGGLGVVGVALALWIAPWRSASQSTAAEEPRTVTPPVVDSTPAADSIPLLAASDTAASVAVSEPEPPVARAAPPRTAARAEPRPQEARPVRQPPTETRATPPAPDTLLIQARQGASRARQGAVGAGASAADLATGDVELSVAEAFVAEGRRGDALDRFGRATTLFVTAGETARRRALAPAQPADTAPAEVTSAADPARDRSQITAALQAYSRALETKDVQEVRRAYPGLNRQQARNLAQSFEFMQDLRVTVTEGPVSVRGDGAEARANLQYRFVNARSHEEQESNVPVVVTLARLAGVWTITDIRQVQ